MGEEQGDGSVSAGLEKHREAPKGLEGRTGAALTLPARGSPPSAGHPGSPSLGTVYPPGHRARRQVKAKRRVARGARGSVKGRGGWIHTDAGGTWGRPDAKAQLSTCLYPAAKAVGSRLGSSPQGQQPPRRDLGEQLVHPLPSVAASPTEDPPTSLKAPAAKKSPPPSGLGKGAGKQGGSR